MKVKVSTMLAAGITFSTGLVLGLLLHVPGVYSPSSHEGHHRRARSVGGDGENVEASPHRYLLQVHPDPPSKRGNNTGVEPVDQKNRYNDRELHEQHIKLNTHIPQSDNEIIEGPSASQVGLSQAISTFKQPQGTGLESKEEANVNGKSSVQGNLGEHDTELVNIEISRAEQAMGGESKHSGARSIVLNKGSWPQYTATSTEVEIQPLRDVSNVDADIKSNKAIPQSLSSLGVNSVLDGVYWSPEVESLTPEGFVKSSRDSWRQQVTEGKFVRVEEGCGRMQNRKLTLHDGTLACARYRLNTDQIQGEIFSYYLARLLAIPNVPPSVLSVPDTTASHWLGVHQEVVSAQWNPSRPIILTPWLDGLKPAYIPQQFRHPTDGGGQLNPGEAQHLHKLPLEELTELVQWSDLIVFDYLTANLDRVVNNMFNLQWNPAMMESPAHNLERSSSSGHLVFLDNESGLFHSYRLLDKYTDYHERLLHSLCVFRKGTADAIARLYQSRDIGKQLQLTFEENEPLSRLVPRIPNKNVQTLQQRLDNVHHQVLRCQSKYGNR